MPNWCENELRVTGPYSERVRMAKEIEGDQQEEIENTMPPKDPAKEFLDVLSGEEQYPIEVLDFHKIKPVPLKIQQEAQQRQNLPGVFDKGFDPDNCSHWDWCVHHWGTKWNASDPYLSATQARHLYVFSTAWSPPEPVILKLSEMYPKLKFQLKYWEGGCAFKGTFTCKAGKILVNDTFDYHGNRGG